MNKSQILVLIGLLCASAGAQSNRDDLTPLEISYLLTVEGDLTTARVDLDVANIRRPSTRVAMPNWMPGAYGIRRFGERVDGLEATAGGRSLDVLRLDHQTWSIDTRGVDRVRVSYSVPIRSRRRGPGGRAGGGGATTGVQIAGPGTYLYVVGAKHRPVTVRYEIPDGWRVANGLLPTDQPDVRRARDYDTFIDAPTILGIFKQFHFDVNGTPFACVFFENEQRYAFDMPGFVDVCRKIVTYQGQLYGSYPFPNYVFLFTLPGGGGLEHLNSTSIGLNPARMSEDVTAGASVTAHEFFHTWNVKRIRPIVLGPFEYEHENYTGNLWVSEGWTSYYGDLTMVRTGIITRQRFLELLEGYIGRELNKESRKEQSVYWASRNVWHRVPGEPSRVDYYATGELLGAAIDLKIRQETGNRKTLDDVMRFMNRWFAERGVGFEEGDVERACTAISNHDFGEFFARYVYGTIDPPFEECFGYAGIAYSEQRLAASLPFAYRETADGLRVPGFRRGAANAVEAAQPPGVPQPGDLIVSLGGTARAEPAAFLAGKKPGETIRITFVRDGETREADVTLVERQTMIPTLRLMDDPTELQRSIRESWLTGRD